MENCNLLSVESHYLPRTFYILVDRPSPFQVVCRQGVCPSRSSAPILIASDFAGRCPGSIRRTGGRVVPWRLSSRVDGSAGAPKGRRGCECGSHTPCRSSVTSGWSLVLWAPTTFGRSLACQLKALACKRRAESPVGGDHRLHCGLLRCGLSWYWAFGWLHPKGLVVAAAGRGRPTGG